LPEAHERRKEKSMAHLCTVQHHTIDGQTKVTCDNTSAKMAIQIELATVLTTTQPVQLSESSLCHLKDCASCRDQLALWIEAARLCRLDESLDATVLAAEADDPGIRKRPVSAGLALFKPGQDPTRGLLVVVNPVDWMDIRAVHKDVAADDFDTLS
jgi:hypothetical protein